MTDIFDSAIIPPADPPKSDAPPPPPQIPPTLVEWVGEGKKYATVDAALASIAPAQQHISSLETELKELREAQARSASVDDVRKTVEELLAQRPADHGKQLDEASVATLVSGLLSQREQEQRASVNAKSVTDALAEAFGDKASERFGEVAQQQGLTRDELGNLARKSPGVVLKLFDLKGTKSHPLRSDLSTSSFGKPSTIPEKKSIMHGATTEAVIEQWRRAGVVAQSKE